MAGKHEQIQAQVIIDHSNNRKGRLFNMRQGYGTPLNSDSVIDFGALF